jgi:adenylate cyclase
MMNRLIDFLKPSPFKMGCLLVLASCFLFYSFGQDKPDMLASLDNQIASAMFRWRGPVETTGEIVIVDIDEKSLRAVGQWPWPRDMVAQLVMAAHEAGAKVIGLDILFAEKDRTSLTEHARALSSVLSGRGIEEDILRLASRDDLNHDLILGRAVAEAPVVLGYVFQLEDDGLKTPNERPFPAAAIKVSPGTVPCSDLLLLSGRRAILNIEEISQAPTEGFLNVFPDSSGMVRKTPLFMELDGIPYPSLALEMVRSALGEDEVTIHASRRKTSEKNPILGFSVGGTFIPCDDRGQISVNFRGPVKTFSYLSAVDVMKGLHAERIRDRYVLIGTSASGLLDFHATPFSGIFPGVEIQATIIDNILTGSLFTYDIFTEIGLTYALIIAGGILLSALLAYTGAITGGLAGLVIFTAIIAGNYSLFFMKGRLLGITYPLATVMGVFLIVTLFNYFFEYRRKQFIHDAFNRYVSPMVVGEIMKRPEKLALAGEEKNLTILFSDIRDFTTLAEGMNPKQLGTFMNTYLTAMSDIIMAHHGMVDKYIGDAIVAIWGAPLDDPNHVRNAVRAALDMKQAMESLRKKWHGQGIPFVDIGIGINTGIASVGNFGSERRFEYTVLGDNVNLASRLEGLNKVYCTPIIISQFTREALNGEFFCRKIDVVRVKGKTIPIEIFEPLAEGIPEPSLKAEVEQFENALEHYFRKDFQTARHLIGELHAKSPSRLYRFYLDRIDKYCTTPPPDDWNGVSTFQSK